MPHCSLYVPRAGSSYPTRDENGHLLQTEYGKCRYKDNQVIGLQELPETAPPGQLPHSGAWRGGAGQRGGCTRFRQLQGEDAEACRGVTTACMQQAAGAACCALTLRGPQKVQPKAP